MHDVLNLPSEPTQVHTGNTTWTLLGTGYYSFVLSQYLRPSSYLRINRVNFFSLFHFIVCISHPVSSSLSPCCFLLRFSCCRFCLFSFVIHYLIALSIFSHIFSTLLLFLIIFWFILHFFPNFSVSFSFLSNKIFRLLLLMFSLLYPHHLFDS